MEVSAKLLNHANATASVKIDAEILKKKVEEIAKKTAKQIKMDGFRPGKVPVSAVLKRYSKELEGDAKQEIFKEVIDKALEKVGKKPDEMLGDAIFSKYEDKDGIIDAELDISFRPDVKVDGYEKLIPEHSTPRVTKKDVEARIEEFLKMLAPIEKVDKKELEKGDYAKFDFEGFIDGEAFEGGKAENYVLEIGSNQFIPGFEDGMIGLKVGEERDVKVKFPENYQAKNLAGKEAVFKVKLHEIQGKKVAKELDEETLKKLMPGEEASKEKFEERIKEDIRAEKIQKLIHEDLKPKFADALVEKYDFDLPKTIVEQEMDIQFRNEWQNYSADEMKKYREDKDALSKKREEFRKEAEKSVKITFIVDELAKLRNVSVSDQEVIQAVYMEGYKYGINPKEHFENYKKNGMLPAIKMAMIEEKLFNDIFKKDKKEDKGE